jgi:hypothetical protein
MVGFPSPDPDIFSEAYSGSVTVLPAGDVARVFNGIVAEVIDAVVTNVQFLENW